MIRNRRGWTLMEIMVTFTILTVVSYFVMSSLPFLREKTRDRRRRYDLAVLKHMLAIVYADTGEYPKTQPGGGIPPARYWVTNDNGYASTVGDWEVHPSTYIPGIIPTYYNNLPQDPNPGAASNDVCPGADKDIAYVSTGEHYKIIYYCASESGFIPDTDPLVDLNSCDAGGLCVAWSVTDNPTVTGVW